MLDNEQGGTVSRRPQTATDREWVQQCQDCLAHRGKIAEGYRQIENYIDTAVGETRCSEWGTVLPRGAGDGEHVYTGSGDDLDKSSHLHWQQRREGTAQGNEGYINSIES